MKQAIVRTEFNLFKRLSFITQLRDFAVNVNYYYCLYNKKGESNSTNKEKLEQYYIGLPLLYQIDLNTKSVSVDFKSLT